MLTFGGWYFSPVLLLAIYGLFLGVKFESVDRPSVWTGAIALLFMIGGYAAVYAIAPAELGRQIGTSMERLLLQLWPSLIFVYFLVIRAPERMPLGSEKRREKRSEKRATASKKQKHVPLPPR
jgi:hypothetical protein